VENQHWLDELGKEFVRRKLPSQYAERLLVELSDHFNDFMEERMSTDAPDIQSIVDQLGSPSDIGGLATEQCRRQRFLSRHPFLVFAVLPIVSLPILIVGLLLGLGGLLYLLIPDDALSSVGAVEPSWIPSAFQLTICFLVVSPAIGLSFILCRAARRAALGWKWPLTACLLLALLSGGVFTKVQPKSADKPGVFLLGVGIPSLAITHLQIIQILAPLAIGGWAVLRQGRTHGRTVSA
jgi:hypothetical protein